MKRVAVLMFPGTNCMRETAVALERAGAEVEVLRWNADPERVRAQDGYVIAGGFAYEDRIRAGVVAAKHRILDVVAEEAARGKPVWGICNGAQILVEAGLVPGLESGRVEVALAANAAPGWRGYFCDWVHVGVEDSPGFLAPLAGQCLAMPVGHAEGRFTGSPEFFDELERRGQIVLRYVDATGERARQGNANPNGSLHDAAGLADPTGRIVAMMPHPERAAAFYQVPEALPGPWGDRRREASGDARALQAAGPGQAMVAAFVAALGRPAVERAGNA